jgi:competence protein ComEC
MHQLRIPSIAALVMLIILTSASLFLQLQDAHTDGLLRVTFLDVGQGDAIFIETPNGTQILIDGGRDASVRRGLGEVMPFFDRDIDVVIATHPDQDHIGGLVSVLKKYKVKHIVMTENITDTPVFEVFQERIKTEQAQITYARRGQVFDFGYGSAGSTTLTILFPDRDPTNLETNVSSIIARLAYGDTSYLLTGDSPNEIEEYLVSLSSTTLKSTVLKAGHHGSKTSSAEAFVTAVDPTYAIISAGKDNSYGHPHKEVTDRLKAHNVIQKNTADEGSIFSVSDGNQVWFE